MSTHRRALGLMAFWAGAVLSALVVGGCGSVRARPIVSTVWVVGDEPAVVSVVGSGVGVGVGAREGGAGRARSTVLGSAAVEAGGERGLARIEWVSAVPAQEVGAGGGVGGGALGRVGSVGLGVGEAVGGSAWRWLAPAVRLEPRALRAGDAMPAGEALTGLITLPRRASGSAVSRGAGRSSVVVEGAEIEVRSLPGFGAGDASAWRSPNAGFDAFELASSAARMRPWLRDPTQRWRVLLATGGLEAEALAIAAAGGEVGGEELDAGERLLRQATARWAAALAVIERADPGVARAFRLAVAGMAEFPGAAEGEKLHPVWVGEGPAARAELEGLVERVLAFGASTIGEVRAWVDEQPTSAAWVIDDGGVPGPAAGGRLVTIGLMNLGPVPAVGLVRSGGASASLLETEARVLGPGRGEAVLLLRSDAQGGGSGAMDRPVRVRAIVGDGEGELTLAASRVGVRPPGASVGPVVADWTLATWTASARRAGPSVGPGLLGGGGEAWAPATVGRVSRGLVVREVEGASGVVSAPVWEVFIETAATGPADAIELYLGPTSATSAVVRVALLPGAVRAEVWRRDGAVGGAGFGVGFGEGADEVAEARLAEGRWFVRVRLPAWAVPEDGRVEAGLVRWWSGGRAAWPRPMMPWQAQPGRVWLDLGAWAGAE